MPGHRPERALGGRVKKAQCVNLYRTGRSAGDTPARRPDIQMPPRAALSRGMGQILCFVTYLNQCAAFLRVQNLPNAQGLACLQKIAARNVRVFKASMGVTIRGGVCGSRLRECGCAPAE